MDRAYPTTLREYAAAYRLHVACPACDHTGPLNLMRWARLVGWATPLETLRHAIRCGACGNLIGLELRLTPLGQREDGEGLVEPARIELAASALRTRRSPS